MTFNTGNPIGSTDARDLSDNAENFDKALGTLDATWVDRLGVTRDSFEGRLAKGSFYRVGTFAAGYTLTNMRQTLEYSGHEYSWAGTFPKVVAAASTPETSGGIGAGAWVDRTDTTLRSDINIVIKRFSSVAAMVADTTLSVGQIVETTSYYNGLYKGGNKYRIVAAGTGTVDGGSYISLLNGLQASGIFEDTINVCQFGAYGDGVADDTAAIQNAINIRTFKVFLPNGTYKLTAGVDLQYGTILTGSGERNGVNNGSRLYQTANAPALQFALDACKVTVSDLTIEGTSTGAYQDGIYFPSSGSGSRISSLWILNMGGHGIHAGGSNTYGIDLVSVKNVKVEACSGYGVKLDLLPGDNGFNNSLFEQVECSKNCLGGFYIDNAGNNVFLKCHAFQNSNPSLSVCHGFYLGGSTTSIKLDTCWPESNGEADNIDPTHKSCGFYLAGGKSNIIDNPNLVFGSIGIRVAGGEYHVIRGGVYQSATWPASADIIINSAAHAISVLDISLSDAPVIANFSQTSIIQTIGSLPASGRLPYQTKMRRGVRGSAFCYLQGTAAAYEISSYVSAIAGNYHLTWNTIANFRVGDNILIPGAGTAGGALSAKIIDVDMPTSTYVIDTPVRTSVSNVVASTNMAAVVSEDYVDSEPSTGFWQIGDRVWYIYTNAHGWTGWICTSPGTPGKWKRMADLLP